VKPVSEEALCGDDLDVLTKRLFAPRRHATYESWLRTRARCGGVARRRIDWIEAAAITRELWNRQRNYFLRESLQTLRRASDSSRLFRASRIAPLDHDLSGERTVRLAPA
jgi:hypothetical protein